MTMHTFRAPCLVVTMIAVVAGCSSATSRREDASRGVPAAGGERSATLARESRRAPDVIGRPRPFRLAEAAAVARPEAPGGAAALPDGPFKPAAPAQTAQHPSAGEIRGMMRDYLRAFNRHDAAALAAHWSPTAENHDIDAGFVTASGRDSVRELFSSLFHRDDEASIDLELTAIRPVTDDVAMVDGITRIEFSEGPPAGSRFSALVVKRDGRWLLEQVRESARPVAEGKPLRPLDDLAWLVGSWEDEGEGVTASTRCTWAGDNTYLVRTHVVTIDRAPEQRPADGDQRIPGLLPAGPQKPREVMEVIGWDPDSRALRSWFFAGDGRFAEGTWHRNGDGWAIHIVGRGRDEGCAGDLTLESHDGHDGLTIGGAPGRLTNLLPPAVRFGRTSR
jgi:uncharacterized protein (TIGR02246 family)